MSCMHLPALRFVLVIADDGETLAPSLKDTADNMIDDVACTTPPVECSSIVPGAPIRESAADAVSDGLSVQLQSLRNRQPESAAIDADDNRTLEHHTSSIDDLNLSSPDSPSSPDTQNSVPSKNITDENRGRDFFDDICDVDLGWT